MSFTITNGVVEYDRTVKPADYEKRGAKVVLSYNVGEGADPAAVMAQVFEMAVAEVHHRIGLNGPAYAAAVAEQYGKPVEPLAGHVSSVEKFSSKAELATAVRKAAEVPQVNPTPTPSKTTSPTSANAFAIGTPAPTSPKTAPNGSDTSNAAVSSPSPANAFSITASAVPQVNPTTTSAPVASPTTNAPSSPVSASAPTPDPVIDGLTDNDLHAVAQAAIEKKIPAQTVRDITAKYAGQQGMTISQIPAEKRPLWLDEVRKLYKS